MQYFHARLFLFAKSHVDSSANRSTITKSVHEAMEQFEFFVKTHSELSSDHVGPKRIAGIYKLYASNVNIGALMKQIKFLVKA